MIAITNPRAIAQEMRWEAARIERKAITPVPISGWQDEGFADGDNIETNRVTIQRYHDGGAGSEAAAMGLAATWACVLFWAGNIASLPLTVYRRGPLGTAVEDTGHPLAEILHASPNYDQSAYDFWEFMVASLEVRGNAYAEIVRNVVGDVVALEPIKPDLMRVRRLANRNLEYVWNDGFRERRHLQSDILHIRGPLGDVTGGISPLTALRRTFSNVSAAEEATASIFRRGVMTSGVLTSENDLSETVKGMSVSRRERMEDLLDRKYQGAINAGRPMLLDGGLKWQSLSMSLKDAEMVASRGLGVEEICRAFEVDPHMIGHTAGNTRLGSSISDQTLGLLKFKMRKRLKRIEGALEKQLLTRAERRAGISIEFNVEALLRADSLGRAQYYQIMKQFMTRNEIRALEGLPPIEGGDTIMVQMQDVAIGETAPPAKEADDEQV